jgi:hypothetical protein
MVMGETPWAAEGSELEQVRAICHADALEAVGAIGVLEDEDCEDLIMALCQRDPHKRLGGSGLFGERGHSREIKEHPWFDEDEDEEAMDWEQLLSKSIEAPWLPTLKDPTDRSHFPEMDDKIVMQSNDQFSVECSSTQQHLMRSLIDEEKLPAIWEVGDRIKVTKEGSHRGKVGVVVDPDGKGQIKVLLDETKDQVDKYSSYFPSEMANLTRQHGLATVKTEPQSAPLGISFLPCITKEGGVVVDAIWEHSPHAQKIVPGARLLSCEGDFGFRVLSNAASVSEVRQAMYECACPLDFGYYSTWTIDRNKRPRSLSAGINPGLNCGTVPTRSRHASCPPASCPPAITGSIIADWWCEECTITITEGSLGINVVEPTTYSPAYRVLFSYFTGASKAEQLAAGKLKEGMALTHVNGVHQIGLAFRDVIGALRSRPCQLRWRESDFSRKVSLRWSKSRSISRSTSRSISRLMPLA